MYSEVSLYKHSAVGRSVFWMLNEDQKVSCPKIQELKQLGIRMAFEILNLKHFNTCGALLTTIRLKDGSKWRHGFSRFAKHYQLLQLYYRQHSCGVGCSQR